MNRPFLLRETLISHIFNDIIHDKIHDIIHDKIHDIIHDLSDIRKSMGGGYWLANMITLDHSIDG